MYKITTKNLEKTIIKHISTDKNVAEAFKNTLCYLETKDFLDDTNYFQIAKSIYLDKIKSSIFWLSRKNNSSEASFYKYRKYILKTFHYFYRKTLCSPCSDDEIYGALKSYAEDV